MSKQSKICIGKAEKRKCYLNRFPLLRVGKVTFDDVGFGRCLLRS